jgi:hypothetical protein
MSPPILEQILYYCDFANGPNICNYKQQYKWHNNILISYSRNNTSYRHIYYAESFNYYDVSCKHIMNSNDMWLDVIYYSDFTIRIYPTHTTYPVVAQCKRLDGTVRVGRNLLYYTAFWDNMNALCTLPPHMQNFTYKIVPKAHRITFNNSENIQIHTSDTVSCISFSAILYRSPGYSIPVNNLASSHNKKYSEPIPLFFLQER